MAKVSFTRKEIKEVIDACQNELVNRTNKDNPEYSELYFATKKLIEAEDTQYTKLDRR